MIQTRTPLSISFRHSVILKPCVDEISQGEDIKVISAIYQIFLLLLFLGEIAFPDSLGPGSWGQVTSFDK